MIKSSSRTTTTKRRKLNPVNDDYSDQSIILQHNAEQSGRGDGYLSTRKLPRRGLRTLREIATRASAVGILDRLYKDQITTVELNDSETSRINNLVGWTTDRNEKGTAKELIALGQYIQNLPSLLSARLLLLVLENRRTDREIAVSTLTTLFFHSTTLSLDLSSFSAPAVLLPKLSHCTALTELSLGSTLIPDLTLSKAIAQLPYLAKLNCRGCAKVGDLTVTALAKTAGKHLKELNLSITNVTVASLVFILGLCGELEVLKLANVSLLNDKSINKLLDNSTALAMKQRQFPLSKLRLLKLRSTVITDASLNRIITLCHLSLKSLDISFTEVRSLDLLALHNLSLEKLVISGLPFTSGSLVNFFSVLSNLPPEQRSRFRKLKLGSIPSISNASTGLTDEVMTKILPYLEKFDGLESVSLFQNWELGLKVQPMLRFIQTVGRRCKVLDLTLCIRSHHLEGLLNDNVPPRIETLILDSSLIDDSVAFSISTCAALEALHISGTKMTTDGLTLILAACPRLSTLNLTSCRGIPLKHRRNFFEAWAAGLIE